MRQFQYQTSVLPPLQTATGGGGGGGGPVAHVQSVASPSNFFQSVTFTISPTPGNIVIATGISVNANDTISINTPGVTWNVLNTPVTDPNFGTIASWWTVAASSSLSITISIANTLGGVAGIADEFSGQDISPIDASVSTVGTGAPTGSITPVSNNDGIWAAACVPGTLNPGSGFTLGTVGNFSSETEFEILSGGAGAPQTVTFSGTTGNFGILMAAIKAAPSSATTVDMWYQQWKDPLLSKNRVPFTDSGIWPSIQFTLAEVITLDKWFGNLSSPRFNSYAQKFNQQLLTPEFTSVDEWYQALVQPQTTKKVFDTNQQSPLTQFTAEVITVDKWLGSLSTPQATKRGIQLDQTIFPLLQFTVENITIDKWLSALSTPTLRKKAFHPEQLPLPLVQELVTVDKWFDGLSLPTLKKKLLQVDQQLFPLVQFATEIITVDKWFSALSSPTLVKRLFQLDQQLFPLVQFASEVITVDKWLAALSLPLAQRKPLQLDQQLYPLIQFVGENITVDKWLSALSIPRKDIRNYFQGLSVLTPLEAITLDKWLKNLSQPGRAVIRTPDQFSLIQLQQSPPPVINLGWLQPLVDTVRKMQGHNALYSSASTMPLIFTLIKFLLHRDIANVISVNEQKVEAAPTVGSNAVTSSSTLLASSVGLKFTTSDTSILSIPAMDTTKIDVED